MIRLAHQRSIGVDLKLRGERRRARGQITETLAGGFVLEEADGLPIQRAYADVEHVGLDFDDAAAFVGLD